MFLILAVGASLVAFQRIAEKRAQQFNTVDSEGKTVIFDHDQHAYLNAGRMMKRSQYTYEMPRHRTPGLPFLLSFFYSELDAYAPTDPQDPRRVSEGYFTRGKHFVILLTILGLVTMFLVIRRWLPVAESLLFLWICMWLLYIFKAPFVRPEPTFYTVFFIGSLLTLQVLIRPTWRDAIAAGAVLAFCYLLKSAVLPLLLLFFACFWLKLGARLMRLLLTRGSSPPDAPVSLPSASRLWVEVAQAHTVLLVFLGLLSPYLLTTARQHQGNPFWSMHSSVFMWTDSKEEISLWASRGITADSEIIPPDAPSARNYLESHTMIQIADRCWLGVRSVLHRIREEFRVLYDYTVKRLLRCAVAAILLSLLAFWRDLRRYWPETLFIVGYFLGFAAIAGWYEMLKTGPRLLLVLFPPLAFLFIFLVHRYGRRIAVPQWGLQIDLRRILLAILTVYLAFATLQVWRHDAWTILGAQ